MNSAPKAGRDVPDADGGPLGLARTIGRSVLALFEPLDERIESAVEHGYKIAIRNPVTQKGLGVTELIMRALTKGELEGEPLGRKRTEFGGRAGQVHPPRSG